MNITRSSSRTSWGKYRLFNIRDQVGVMANSKADKQKQKAKELLGISDDRAKEIFEEQPDRKQQKKKELEE